MTVKQIIEQNELTLSFEVFPPRGSLSQAEVNQALCELAPLNPDWISVTCSAGGSGGADPIASAQFIKQFGCTPVIHHTCASNSVDMSRLMMETASTLGLSNVMALRGDLNDGVCRGFPYASKLVEYIKELKPDFCVGVATYPEGHSESPNVQHDVTVLKEKQDCGADYAVTQLFYDNTAYLRFRELCFRTGVTIPVIPGVMPIISKKSLQRILKMTGANLDPSLKFILDRFGDDDQSLMEAGLVYTSKQIVDLLSYGVTNIHLYTMNKPVIAKRIVSNLSSIFASRRKDGK